MRFKNSLITSVIAVVSLLAVETSWPAVSHAETFSVGEIRSTTGWVLTLYIDGLGVYDNSEWRLPTRAGDVKYLAEGVRDKGIVEGWNTVPGGWDLVVYSKMSGYEVAAIPRDMWVPIMTQVVNAATKRSRDLSYISFFLKTQDDGSDKAYQLQLLPLDSQIPPKF